MDALEDTGTRKLTVEEAISFAILLQKDERLTEAQALYARVLDAVPDHPHALHYAGVLAHQQGRTDEALALIERSLEVAPDRADYFNNLGIVQQAAAQFDAAIEAYERAIALDPGHANAYSNLGVLLRATGKPAESETAYRRAIQINPEHIDAYTNLGILLNGLGRTQEAAACFCRVITLRPKHCEARKLLALAHSTLGEIGEAARIFEEWLAEEPGDPIATHMLAACTGRGVPARASDGFIEQTFDSFAASFESKLQRLSYRAPALVAAMLEDACVEPVARLDILDCGCGTGLCGPLVAPYARRLTGVDLSEGMLAQAKEKKLYTELIRRELAAYLNDQNAAFDVIVSADALVYFGDLEPVVHAAARALRPDGLLIFTLEHAVNAAPQIDRRLEVHGRYSHARGYVERILTAAGLKPDIVPADLRMEAGSPVPGLVIRARRV